MKLTATANNHYEKPPENDDGESVITHRYLGSYDYQQHQAQQKKQPSLRLVYSA